MPALIVSPTITLKFLAKIICTPSEPLESVLVIICAAQGILSVLFLMCIAVFAIKFGKSVKKSSYPLYPYCSSGHTGIIYDEILAVVYGFVMA